MRARVIGTVVGGLALAVAVATWAGRGGTEQASPFPAKTMTVGAVEIRVEPHHIDATGARVQVTLDTHTTDLGMRLAATLRVDGQTWSGGTWSGDAPSGHHRAGAFAFQAAGQATGVATFSLTGFDEPVTAEWRLDE